MNARRAQFEAARNRFGFPADIHLWPFNDHAELLKSLQERGWCKLPIRLMPLEAQEVCWCARQARLYNAHVKAQSDGVVRSFTELRFTSAHACLDPADTLRLKLLHDLCLHEKILALASAYFDGAMPLCYSMNAWWTFPRPSGEMTTTQGFHRDHDTFRFLACFVTLTTTGYDFGGELAFVERSHDPDMLPGSWLNDATQEEVRARDAEVPATLLSGNAGEIFLADTWAWHKAMPTKQDRLVAWFRYAINKPDSFTWDKLDQVRKLDQHGMGRLEKHVLQLFL